MKSRFSQNKIYRQKLTQWLSTMPWQFFITCTFARAVGFDRANQVWKDFINLVEQKAKAPLSWVRCDEQLHLSGCGMPSIRLHFHAVLSCGSPVSAGLIKTAWHAFAGLRSDGSGCHVEKFNPGENGLAYMLKNVDDNLCDWSCGGLRWLLLGGQGSLRKRVIHRQQLRCATFDRWANEK